MKHSFETVMALYIDEVGGQLSPLCGFMFTVIAKMSFGMWQEECLIDTQMIMEKLKITKRTAMVAIDLLQTAGLIVFVQSAGGRGRRNSYSVNFDTIETMQKLHSKKNSVNIGTIRSSEKGISSKEGLSKPDQIQASPGPTPSASASVKRRSSIPSQPKRSSDEHMVFDEVWTAFESRRGKIEPGMKQKEAIAVWGLIDKAKTRDGEYWEAFLKNAIAEFWRIKTSRRQTDEFLGKQPFLPSALNSSGIWPRVIEGLKAEEPSHLSATDILAGVTI